jgi:hypothetical protein
MKSAPLAADWTARFFHRCRTYSPGCGFSENLAEDIRKGASLSQYGLFYCPERPCREPEKVRPAGNPDRVPPIFCRFGKNDWGLLSKKSPARGTARKTTASTYPKSPGYTRCGVHPTGMLRSVYAFMKTEKFPVRNNRQSESSRILKAPFAPIRPIEIFHGNKIGVFRPRLLIIGKWR